jgi:DNA helicase-2/ATP-dependent DNA helicase PcrA
MYEALDGENEALFIADTIQKLLSATSSERAAVLYRTNSQSRQIEEALRRYGRKYVVVGGFSFYQRAEVKDVLSYLKVLSTPQDPISLLRIINTPARGIGKSTVEQIEAYSLNNKLSAWKSLLEMLQAKAFPTRAEASLKNFVLLIEDLSEYAKTARVHEALEAVINRSGYREMLTSDASAEAESRLGNLDELLNAAAEAAERGETMAEFLDHAALVADSDQLDEQASVSLLTVHNAKGLEFQNVFLAGMEEDLFPHSRSVSTEGAMEEERRLCYVGMTRARKRLYLSWARYRRRFGGGQPEACLRSRFVNEVPPNLTERLSKFREHSVDEVDLYSEQHDVRQSAKKNLYTGRTVNSIDNIAQFFAERGMPLPSGLTRPAPPAAAQGASTSSSAPIPIERSSSQSASSSPGSTPTQPRPPVQSRFLTPGGVDPPSGLRPTGARPAEPKKGGLRAGAVIHHKKYGQGRVLRREGDGDDAKLTISFQEFGLKKIVEKYLDIKAEE